MASARTLNKLNDTIIRNFKPAERARLSDGGGLYLDCHPSGKKVWQFKYRDSDGKLRSATIGEYPGATLAEARKRSDSMRDSVAAGLNPSSVKDREERFWKWVEIVLDAKENGSKDGKARSAATMKRDRLVIEKLKADLGALDVRTITTSQLDDALRKVDSDENRYRCRYLLQEVFDWIVFKEVLRYNPAAALKNVHKQPSTAGYAALTEPQAVGQLLLAIRGYEGLSNAEIALELLLRTAARQGEIRNAKWSWLDWKKGVLMLPAEVTKTRMGRELYLSRQSLTLLKKLEADRRQGNDYILPAARSVRNGPPGGEPMSAMTMNRALQRLGYYADKTTPHGFRKTFSTIANESGEHRPDVIEAFIGHVQPGVRGIYNKARYATEQKALAQWWSDELDKFVKLAEEKRPVVDAWS